MRELRVVFDTNPLYTVAPHELVNAETRKLIEANSSHHDLRVSWYVPDVVINERQYQMRAQAEELLPAFRKITAVLGIDIPIEPAQLSPKIATVIDAALSQLKITRLQLDHTTVEWSRIVRDASFRVPPFQPGKTEKGFRDAIVLETFAQLVESSPSSATRCRLALITGDDRLTEAAKTRIGTHGNAEVIPSLQELQNLINVLISTADEPFVKKMREKARKLFFVPDDKETLYFREKIAEKIREKYSDALRAVPEGADTRETEGIKIAAPRFLRKEGQQMYWSSQVRFEAAAYKLTVTYPTATPNTGPAIIVGDLSTASDPSGPLTLRSLSDYAGLKGTGLGFSPLAGVAISSPYTPGQNAPATGGLVFGLGQNTPTTTKTLFKKGVTVIDVAWSATVDRNGRLVRPRIGDISLTETTWSD